jgi:hypothetical protein
VKVVKTCPAPNTSPTTTCGPVTVLIKPGLGLKAVGGQLKVEYDSNDQVFPGPDSCSSGLMEMYAATGASAPSAAFDPANLLKKNVTDVTGTWTRSLEPCSSHGVGPCPTHTVVNFTVRFTRLP